MENGKVLHADVGRELVMDDAIQHGGHDDIRTILNDSIFR
jgi:hypothetical protein